MKDSFGTATQKISDRSRELVDRAGEVADDVRQNLDATFRDVSRSAKRAAREFEGKVDDGRREIRKRPIASVSIGILAGAALGFLIGFALGKDQD
jgi:hypothetical protein